MASYNSVLVQKPFRWSTDGKCASGAGLSSDDLDNRDDGDDEDLFTEIKSACPTWCSGDEDVCNRWRLAAFQCVNQFPSRLCLKKFLFFSTANHRVEILVWMKGLGDNFEQERDLPLFFWYGGTDFVPTGINPTNRNLHTAILDIYRSICSWGLRFL